MPTSLRLFLIAALALVTAPAPAGAGGDLDAGFGDDGKVVVTPPPDAGEIAAAHVVLPDGSVVVAGTAAPARSGYAFLVLRVLPDGRLDQGFGSGGRVWTDLVTVGWPVLDGAVAGGVVSLGTSAAYAVAVQPGGRIVVAGTTSSGTSAAYAVAVQPGGRIVVAGTTSSGASAAYALVRYLPDGRLDTGFGSGGLVVTDFDAITDDVASALVLLPDGRIVAAGRAGDRFALARYLPDGQLDPSFGAAGLVTTRQGLIAGLAAGLDGAGRIVLAGQGGAPGGPYDLAVSRYLPDGKLDPTFGDRGVVRNDLDTAFGPGGVVGTDVLPGRHDGSWAATGLPSGGLVVTGTSLDQNNSYPVVFLLRYAPTP